MLIDILSFIRQLLLPTWRQPRYEGATYVLYSPMQYILDQITIWKREVLFRTGLTGQKMLLEYYLQDVVDGRIFIVDEDGVRVDFSVIIPSNLSLEKINKTKQIVATYKLPSKRYEVRTVGVSTVGTTYTFGITAVEKIPNDSNGAWRIVLGESERGIRTFVVKWYKGSTLISSYQIDNLNTLNVNYLYFNPKNEEPWHLASNGAGTYNVRVELTLSDSNYFDVKPVIFTAAELGLVAPPPPPPIDPSDPPPPPLPPTGFSYITGWTEPVDPNKDVDITVDAQNIVARFKLLEGDGNYTANVKYQGNTLTTINTTYQGSTTLSFASNLQGVDVIGKVLQFEFVKQGGGTQVVNYYVPKLVYFAYTPGNEEADNLLKIRYRKYFNSARYVLADWGDNQGMGVHYHLNGAVATVGGVKNSTVLPSTPVPATRRLTVMKVLIDSQIGNINTQGWMMFAGNIQVGQTPWNCKVSQLEFWIKTAENQTVQ